MIQRKEVAIIQKRMDDFIDFAYEDIFGTNSYSDNGFDLNYYQLLNFEIVSILCWENFLVQLAFW